MREWFLLSAWISVQIILLTIAGLIALIIYQRVRNPPIDARVTLSQLIFDNFTTRAFIAGSLNCSMIALTFVLALRAPESDAFKVLLGAMLTVGFASAIGWYFNSSLGSEKKDDIQAEVAGKLADKVAIPAAVAAAVAPTTDMLGQSMLSNGQLTYFKSLTDEEAKKSFLAMSASEREATVAKVGT